MEAGGAGARTFSTRAAARIIAVPPERIRYWVRRRLVTPTLIKGRRFRFDFNELLHMRQAKELLPSRRHLERVRRCLERVRAVFGSGRPMSALKMLDDDGRIVVRAGNLSFEAESGQLLLDFAGERRGKLEDGFGPARVKERFEEAKRMAESDPLKALMLYKDLVGREPRNLEAHWRLAALLEREGDLTGSLRHLLGAAAIMPANSEAHQRLGLLYRKRGEDERALASFLRAVECDPSALDSHRNLAELYEKLGRKREALRHLGMIHRLTRPQ